MSPAWQPSSSEKTETFGNFDLINRVKPGFAEITVSSWRSRTTGLNVVHLDYEGERVAAAVSHPSSYVHRLYSADSSYREWLFCSAHREYANLPPQICTLSYNSQFSMTRVARTLWNSEYTLRTRGFVPNACASKSGLHGL